MERICDNCIYCYKPTSIKDYFDKTLTMPNLCEWGVDVFKHKFWLCSNPTVSKVDHSNDSLIYKPCIAQNFRGVCEYFKIQGAEDIIPSSIEITSAEPIPEKIKTGTEIILEATVIPANIPAVTKEVTVEKEVPVTDDKGNPLYDDNNMPITEVKEVTETVIVVPEHENDQNIHYTYLWYKNGRKLYKETKPTITVDTSEEEVAFYTCELIQNIKQNGDGGQKSASVFSNEISLNIVKPTVNQITLTVKTGSVEIFLPLPFKIADYHFPVTGSWANDWTIKSASESEEGLELTAELLGSIVADCSDGIEADIGADTLGMKVTKQNTDGTVSLTWETIE